MVRHPASIFSIVTGYSEPIYRQLMDQIRLMINSGQLRYADVLPSVQPSMKNCLQSHTELLRPNPTRAAFEAKQLELGADTVLVFV